jgi:DHA1 family tetracycline resistance protein-like MFS transporter
VLTLFLIVFVDLVGFGLILPLLPFYAQHFGASNQVISVLFTMYSVGQFFASPFLGRLSDRIGRRPVLIFSQCGNIIAYIALAHAHSLALIFVARFFAGITAGNIATAQAYIADITTPQNRAKGMGVLGAAFGLGFIVGPAIGGLLTGSVVTDATLARPAYLAAIMSAIAMCGVIFRLPESLTAERRAELHANPRVSRLLAARQVLREPTLQKLILTYFITTIAMAIMETSFTLWANGTFGYGPKQVGLIFAGIGIVLAGVQGGLIGKLIKYFREELLVAGGAFLLLAGLAGEAISHTLPELIGASVLIAVGYGIAQPSFNSLMSRRAPAASQGMVMGVAQSASSLSRVIGPLLSGVAFYAGLSAPFILAALLMLPVGLLALALVRASKTAAPPASSAP